MMLPLLWFEHRMEHKFVSALRALFNAFVYKTLRLQLA